MIAKPFIYKPVFFVVAALMAVLYLPSAFLSLVAPNWAFAAQAREFTGSFVRLACEPGCKRDNPYFLPGDPQFAWEPGPHWTLGFAKQNLTDSAAVREGIKNGVYRVAGFGPTKTADIMDDMYTKAIYLDDNTERGGILYAVIDCVGISNTDANKIRALVWDWAKDKGIRSIQVAATHSHACIDTIGMWGLPFDGKVPAFQQMMIEKTAQAMKAAYTNRQNGKLFMATAEAGNYISDNRDPVAFERLITRFRFVPDPAIPGAKDVYLLSAGVHPETVGSNNPVITADFPAYAAKYIFENKDGAETIFIQGALGAMVTVRDLRVYSEDRLKLVRDGGVEFAQYVLGERGSVSVETELPALLNIASAEFELPIENLLFILAIKAGILNHTGYNVWGKSFQYAATCEVSYLRLGDKTDSVDILVAPSEPAPELFLGGFMSAEESALGTEYPRKAIFEYLSEHEFASERQIVFGMANNFTGYVIPENDFLLHKWLPYILRADDRFERGHYEETNSAGPQTARVYTEAFCRLFGSIKA